MIYKFEDNPIRERNKEIRDKHWEEETKKSKENDLNEG